MANNGCNNRPLPEDWVKTLLDGNPSPNFVGLCETLESAGYTFGRSDFARALVSDVPQSTSDRASGVNATNGDHQIASLDDRAAASDQSREATNIGLVHDRGTDVQHSTPPQEVQKKHRGRPKKTATSEVPPNSKGKNAAIIPLINMPEASAQSTIEDIQSPKSKHDIATDTSAQSTVHDNSNSSSATPLMYSPLIPKGPTPQSVNYGSSEVQPESSQPDKHFAPPHPLWHGPPSSHHPPFRSQPLFFNNDDISYIQDSHDSDPQCVTHKMPQSTQLSEATNNRPGPSNVEVMNHSSHPKAQVPTNQHPAPPLSAKQHVEQHKYFHNHRVASVTPAQMAPVAPMVGMPQPPVEQPAPPAHQAAVNPPLLDTPPPPEVVPDISKLPPVLMLLGKEKVVKKISKRKAARVSTYDPKTIARNVLLATGRHPNMAPLNSHLFPLLAALSNYMDKDSDLETLRWDLIDPVPEGAKVVELLDEDDDLVMGDLEPVAQSPEKDLTPSPPRPREPRSRHRWKKPSEEDNGSESKQERGKERKKGKLDGANAKSTPAPSNPNPPAASSSTGPKLRAAHPRASLGELLTSAIATHSATDKGRRATMPGALTTDGSIEENAAGVEKEAAAPPRPRPRGPRMRLVGPPATPKTKSKKATPKASSWTPVNKAEASISPRSKLAAVVIQSRTPSAAESGENSTKKSGKRKNEDPDGSIRPRKRAPIAAVDNGGSCPPPMFDTVKCGWKDCRAQLHTVGLLRKHTTKVHKHKASFGGYPCYWEGCSRPMASGKKGKGLGGIKEKVGQYLDLDTEKEWEDHMESAHLSGLAQLEEAGEFNIFLKGPCWSDSEY